MCYVFLKIYLTKKHYSVQLDRKRLVSTGGDGAALCENEISSASTTAVFVCGRFRSRRRGCRGRRRRNRRRRTARCRDRSGMSRLEKKCDDCVVFRIFGRQRHRRLADGGTRVHVDAFDGEEPFNEREVFLPRSNHQRGVTAPGAPGVYVDAPFREQVQGQLGVVPGGLL